MPLVVVSPSGRVKFVCLICGEVTTVPLRECGRLPSGASQPSPTPRHERDYRYRSEWPDSLTCHEIETRINESIQKHIDEKLVLDVIEDELRDPIYRKCEACRGYGCHI